MYKDHRTFQMCFHINKVCTFQLVVDDITSMLEKIDGACSLPKKNIIDYVRTMIY